MDKDTDLKGLLIEKLDERFDAEKIKQLSGGDPFVSRKKYGKFELSFRPTHKLFLLTGHAPHHTAAHEEFWRRMTEIPLEFSFINHPK